MNTRRKLLGGLGLLALGGAVGQGLGSPFSRDDGRRNARAPFPNVQLLTHEGREVRFYDDLVRDKVVAIHFMYVQCKGSCPAAIANLRRLQDLLGQRLGRDVFLYSLTLQPRLDTPEVLRDYAIRLGVRPGWLFLTGAERDIERLRFSLGFYDPEPDVDGQITNHIGVLRIGNDRTQRWAMAPLRCEAERIIATINHVDTAMVATAHRTTAAPV